MSELILGIETSTAWTGVALSDGHEPLAHRHVESQASHNEVLSGLVDEVMVEAGTKYGDLALIACSIGPGSFTSLRIGLLTAEGIAFAHNLEIIPVMTLDVLNASYPVQTEAEFRLPIIDAYKNEVFTAFYQGAERKSEPVIVDPAFISSLVGGKLHQEPVTVFGPPAGKYEDSLHASLRGRIRLPANPEVFPCPLALVKLAAERPDQSRDPADLEPFYLRMPDARKPKH